MSIVTKVLLMATTLLFSIEVSTLLAEATERVRGVVVDARTGESLPGVSIVVQGSSVGTSTDINGEFELEVPSLDIVLILSSIGFEQKMFHIDGRSELLIELRQAIILGDELVVVGYGMQRRSDLTGSLSSISRQDIISEPIYSFENALQGRAAGVNISANGFRPGEGSTIRIRGNRSFVAGNDPLLVLDGVPIEGSFNDINPRDIESVEILKDASATAIYGSRGANGVILVTTRRGVEGISIDYSSMIGLQRASNRLDLMNTEQYAEFVREAARRDGSYTGNDADIFRSWELDAIANNRTTDWQDLVFDLGFQQQHSLSVRGRSSGTSYAISGTFDEHFATVKNNDFRRYSFRLNLDQEISSWLTVGLSSNLNNSQSHRSVDFQNVVGNFPMSSAFDSDGNVLMIDEIGDRNPLFDMKRDNNLNKRDRTRLISTIYANLNFSENLSLRLNYSPDLTYSNIGSYVRDDLSRAGIRDESDRSILYEAILNYMGQFGEVHRLNFTSMYSIQNFGSEFVELGVEGLPYEEQLYFNLGSADRVTNRASGLSDWTLESFMLRGNYVYDNRYMFTLTGRLDGSSRLASGNEYGIFPSVAFAWQIGNESFMRDVSLFSELKLRFSIGDVGNTAIQPYQTQGALSPLFYAFGQNIQLGFAPGDIPNPDLKWERTRSIDMGLDFAILQDRISGSIDIYQSNTRDLLLERQLPSTSGYNSTLENVGETRNRGFEFNLSSVNIQSSRFQWRSNFNFATNRNEILELFGGRDDDPGSGWFIGQPINVNYYWELVGIWQLGEEAEAAQYGKQPGDFKFRDVTGSGSYDGDDRVIQGSPDPKWTAGISNNLTYRNFDLSFFMYAAQGVMSNTEFGKTEFDGLFSFRPIGANNVNVNYWTPNNPSNKYPRPRNASQMFREVYQVQNTSYVRVRNITLGFSMPQQTLSRFGIRNARVYTSAQNPFTFTSFKGYDPEGAANLDMPNYRSFIFGIDLNF